MANKALVKLVEYPIYRSDLDALPTDQAAALAVVCYAHTEISTLYRIYLFSAPDVDTEGRVLDALLTQKMVIMRAVSAKLFEFFEFLALKGEWHRTKDSTLKELCRRAEDLFGKLRSDPGYKVAEALRNQATHHYSLKEARRNLGHLDGTSQFSEFSNQLFGSSFSQLGEGVLFYANLRKQDGKILQTDPRASQAVDDWLDWVMEASKMIANVHALFVEELVVNRHPDRRAKEQIVWVDPKLVGEIGQHYVPLFLRKPANK